MKEKRSFKGVWIPKEIWLDSDLSIIEKCLLTEISSLDNEIGCFASNKYFSEFFGIGERQVSKYISRLQENGKIIVSIIGRNKRSIVMEQKFYQGTNKSSITDGTKVLHNNIGNNTVNNTVNLCEQSSREEKQINEVIKMFEIVNPSYEKMYPNKTQRSAAARLLKKWTLPQIQAVIGILPKLNADQYAKGKSITPLQLEDNLGYIKAFIDKTRDNSIRQA